MWKLLVAKYLNDLKEKGNFSLAYLVKATEFSESTIRKILSGETANPGIDTVIALVTAMGGRMSDLDSAGSEKEDEVRVNAMVALKESYETRIIEIKSAYDQHLETVTQDKRFFRIAACCLGGFLLLVLLIDIMFGDVGWIRH